ncbi:major facilitator superfamily domain-containing protein [Auriculariales sp. MPI-PUGE-AT-0066]|nr:major facilitator superfamily domain-containing protein [Auriculariales sp. MPI-PUGE-AT-0066]
MTQLIVFRALQGVGAAAIYSGVIVTMSTMVPKTELATFGSIIGAVFSVSNSIGPIIGGVIVQNIHWSWLFFINLPIALVGSVLIWFSVHDPDVARTWNDVARRVDWFGSLLILSFSLLLCTPLQLGGTVGYPWKSVSIIVPMILAGLIIPVFFWVESRHPEPVIPLRLFAIRNASVGILITMCIGAGFFLICIFLPQRMQVVNGLSPLNAGVRMLPLVALAGFMSMGVGILVRVVRNVRIPTWFGMILGSIGGGLLASMKVDTPYSTQVGFQVLVGVAFGFIIVLSTIAIQFSLDRKDLATAMGTQSFVRQIGGLIAIAVGTAFVNSQVNGAIDEKGLPAAILVAPEQVLKQLPPELLAVAREAYSTGFSRSFSEATAWFILGTFISFGLAHQVPDEFYVKAKGGDAETASPEDEVKATDPSRLSDEKHD